MAMQMPAPTPTPSGPDADVMAEVRSKLQDALAALDQSPDQARSLIQTALSELTTNDSGTEGTEGPGSGPGPGPNTNSRVNDLIRRMRR
jgi:hypothetical protein